MSGDKTLWGLAAGIAACFGVMVLLVFASIDAAHSWNSWCESQGGHVVSSSKTVTTVGVNPGNGQPVIGIGSQTTYFCLSADGRILGIR